MPIPILSQRILSPFILSPIPLAASELSRCGGVPSPPSVWTRQWGAAALPTPCPLLTSSTAQRMDGEQRTSACGLGGGRLPCPSASGERAALGEGKGKDQLASKEEAKLFALLTGLSEEADSRLDGKEISQKQCQYAILAV